VGDSKGVTLLSVDEVLATTRAVRRRLDLTRSVPANVLGECLALAQQAPTASNMQSGHFVVVTAPDLRAALAELCRRTQLPDPDPSWPPAKARMMSNVAYLRDHLHEVPVHVIPCVELGDDDGASHGPGPGFWGSIVQSAWSFMLAARSRGLGTVWTTIHLYHEEEAARLLGIPYPQVRQAALIPVAYAIGSSFRPGPRKPLDEFIHWGDW
jgi:nitroreductase